MKAGKLWTVALRDARRSAQELPLIREFTVRVIANKFGIDNPTKEHRGHLHELRGWKRAIGKEMVERIMSGEKMPDKTPSMFRCSDGLLPGTGSPDISSA